MDYTGESSDVYIRFGDLPPGGRGLTSFLPSHLGDT